MLEMMMSAGGGIEIGYTYLGRQEKSTTNGEVLHNFSLSTLGTSPGRYLVGLFIGGIDLGEGISAMFFKSGGTAISTTRTTIKSGGVWYGICWADAEVLTDPTDCVFVARSSANSYDGITAVYEVISTASTFLVDSDGSTLNQGSLVGLTTGKDTLFIAADGFESISFTGITAPPTDFNTQYLSVYSRGRSSYQAPTSTTVSSSGGSDNGNAIAWAAFNLED